MYIAPQSIVHSMGNSERFRDGIWEGWSLEREVNWEVIAHPVTSHPGQMSAPSTLPLPVKSLPPITIQILNLNVPPVSLPPDFSFSLLLGFQIHIFCMSY